MAFSVSSTAKKGPSAASGPARSRDDDRRGGAGVEGASDEVVAVVSVALDGEEEIAGLKRPAVDRDAADGRAQRRARRGAERAP